MDTKWNYFQYQKNHEYPVYIRSKNDEVNPKFLHLLHELGFHELAEKDSKKVSLQKPHTKILTVQNAGPRVQMQINGSDLLDKYGSEILSFQGGAPVYAYRRVGMLVLPPGKVLWDLALSQDISLTDQMVGLRIILVRFLAMALAEQGLLCYWGTIKDGTVFVMKQNQSFGESIVIDFNKRIAFCNDGEIKLGSSLRLIRKDKDVRHASSMGREELISFLSVSTCLLSFTGITPVMRKMIYELSSFTSASYGVSELSPNL